MLKVAGSISTKIGRRADARDAAAGRKKRVGGRDNGVTGPDPERHQDREQRVRSRGNADRMLGAAIIGQRAFKFLHLRVRG